MAFPSVISSFTNPNAGDKLNSPSHSSIETAQNTELIQIEKVIGTDASVIGTIIGDIRNPNSSGGGHIQSANKGGTGQISYTKGDLLIATSASVLAKLAVGSDAQLLTADSTQSSGIKWVSNSGSPTLYPIDLPVSGLGNHLGKVAFGADFSNTSPTYLFIANIVDSSDMTIYQFVKNSDGNYVYNNVSATKTPTNGGYNNVNMLGVACDSTYVYVYFSTNASSGGGTYVDECWRYLQSDLTGATAMTGKPATNSGNQQIGSGFFYDSTTSKFWLVYSSTVVKGMTVSGSAFTVTDTITLSVAITNIYDVLIKKTNGNFVILDLVTSSPQIVRTYGSTGTQSSALTKVISAYGNYRNPVGICNMNGFTKLAIIEQLENNAQLYAIMDFKYFDY